MTFAMYNSKLSSNVQLAIEELENANGDANAVPIQNRWDFLRKFQQNWDHWYVSFINPSLHVILTLLLGLVYVLKQRCTLAY